MGISPPRAVSSEIIVESKNSHIIAVKQNQKKLYSLLEAKRESCKSIDEDISEEVSRDRKIIRTVELYDNLGYINQNY